MLSEINAYSTFLIRLRFKETIVNRTFLSLHEESLKTARDHVPLRVQNLSYFELDSTNHTAN